MTLHLIGTFIQYFSVFDYKNARVGMALANHGYREEAILEQSDE